MSLPKEARVITIHFGTNHGSVLQAYALSNYLSSVGVNTAVIDYVPERYKIWNNLVLRKRSRYPLPIIAAYYPIAVLKNLRVRKIFELFLKRNLELTKRYGKKEDLKQNPPNADVYIAGSDQIWNDDYNGKDDLSYFLDFAPRNAKRVAYAASFGKEDIFEQDYIDKIKPLLLLFDKISVREMDAQRILSEMKIDSVHVVDPVFLLSKQQWTKFGAPIVKKEAYTLVYVMDGLYSELLDYAQKVKEQTGNKIYVVAFTKIKDKRIDKNFYLTNPKDFVGLISGANMVVTNSFHGTAFSILFQKMFVTIGKTKYNSRMLSLLDKLSLRKHFIPTGANYEVEKVQDAARNNDIIESDDNLQNWIKQSKEFIRTSLETH